MLFKIKLRFLSIGLAAILACLLSQPALAYYTTLGTATNVVTSGNITLQINEMTDQGTEFPEEGVYVTPGDIVSKVVTVENICEHPFYLRVKLVYGIDAQELPAEACFKLNINAEHWTLKDGWKVENLKLCVFVSVPDEKGYSYIVNNLITAPVNGITQFEYAK